MKINHTRFGEGFPLVFFHGWGFDSHIWLPLVPDLERKYQIILIDLPGFGLTSMMSWSDFKQELLCLLPKEFALIGWSMGGLYASRLAIEHPERVKYLINVSSSPRFINDPLWPGVSKEVFVTFYTNLSANTEQTLDDFISIQLNKKKISVSRGNPPSIMGLQSGLEILDTWDLREGLKSLTIPTYFMFGRLDPITPVTTMKAMELYYPDFNYFLFRKSAHMPFLSEQQEFVNKLLGVL